jgi:uncharacterized membrane protein YhaH (DUF805 family)
MSVVLFIIAVIVLCLIATAAAAVVGAMRLHDADDDFTGGEW